MGVVCCRQIVKTQPLPPTPQPVIAHQHTPLQSSLKSSSRKLSQGCGGLTQSQPAVNPQIDVGFFDNATSITIITPDALTKSAGEKLPKKNSSRPRLSGAAQPKIKICVPDIVPNPNSGKITEQAGAQQVNDAASSISSNSQFLLGSVIDVGDGLVNNGDNNSFINEKITYLDVPSNPRKSIGIPPEGFGYGSQGGALQSELESIMQDISQEDIDELEEDLMLNDMNQDKHQGRRFSKAPALNQPRNGLQPLQLRTLQRHQTVRAKKTPPVNHAGVDGTFATFSATSNQSGSNFAYGLKVKNDNSSSSKDIENKPAINKKSQLAERKRKFGRIPQMSSGNQTCYFPNAMIEEMKDYPSQEQSLRDFGEFRNSSFDRNDNQESSSEDRQEDKQNSFDKGMGDNISQGSFMIKDGCGHRSGEIGKNYLKQISNMTFLKPQSSIRFNAQVSIGSFNQQNYSSSEVDSLKNGTNSPSFYNKQPTKTVKSGFKKINDEIKESKTQQALFKNERESSEKSSVSHSSFKTNSSMESEEEEEKEQKKQTPSLPSSRFGEADDNKRGIINVSQFSSRAKPSNPFLDQKDKHSSSDDNKNVDQKDTNGEPANRFFKLQTFKDWVDYPKSSDNIFQSTLKPIEAQKTEEESWAGSDSSMDDDNTNKNTNMPQIIVNPPKLEVTNGPQSSFIEPIDKQQRGNMEEVKSTLSMNPQKDFLIDSNMQHRRSSNLPPSSQKPFKMNTQHIRSTTPQNRPARGGTVQIINAIGPHELSRLSGKIMSRHSQFSQESGTNSILFNSRDLIEMSSKKGMQQISQSDSLDDKSISNYEGSRLIMRIKKSDYDNLSILEQLCDQAMNPVVRVQTPNSKYSSSGNKFQDSSKAGSSKDYLIISSSSKPPFAYAKTLKVPRVQDNMGQMVGRLDQQPKRKSAGTEGQNIDLASQNQLSSDQFTLKIVSVSDSQMLRSDDFKENQVSDKQDKNIEMNFEKKEPSLRNSQSASHFSTIIEHPEEDRRSSYVLSDINKMNAIRKDLQKINQIQGKKPKLSLQIDMKSLQKLHSENAHHMIQDCKSQSQAGFSLISSQNSQTIPLMSQNTIEHQQINSTSLQTHPLKQAKSTNYLIYRSKITQKAENQLKTPQKESNTVESFENVQHSDAKQVPKIKINKISIPILPLNKIDKNKSEILYFHKRENFAEQIVHLKQQLTVAAITTINSNQPLNESRNQVQPLSRVRSQFGEKTLFLKKESIPNSLSFKFSHNSPQVNGRNLISSIKRVISKCEETVDPSLIPNLLQQVRIKQMKTQFQKQFIHTQKLTALKQRKSAINLSNPTDLQRQKSLEIQDSDRLFLFNKNTLDDEAAINEQRFEEQYCEDQSCFSNNTPYERDTPFNFGSQYNRMFSTTSSNYTPIEGVLREFNPADYSYSYEIHQNNSSDYVTSCHSITSPSQKNGGQSYYQDQFSTISNTTPHIKGTQSPMGFKVFQHANLTPNNRLNKHRKSYLYIKEAGNANDADGRKSMIISQAQLSQIMKDRPRMSQINPLYTPTHYHHHSHSVIPTVPKFREPLAVQPQEQLNSLKIPILIETIGNSSLRSSQRNMQGLSPTQFQNFATQKQVKVFEPKSRVGQKRMTTIVKSKFGQKNTEYDANFHDTSISNFSNSIIEDLKNEMTASKEENNLTQIVKTSSIRKASHFEELYSEKPATSDSQNLVTLPKEQNEQPKTTLGYNLKIGDGYSLSPYSRGPKSSRSITTISAISTKINGKKLINQYMVIQTIGKGKFSKVAQCMDQHTKQIYAMKVMNKTKLKKILISKQKHAYNAVETEIAILKKLDHQNIVRLFEIIDDPKHDKLYLITEFIKNGTLLQRINGKTKPSIKSTPPNPLTEDSARKYFRQLISAIEYCHENAKIIHRDIKPENILIDENDNIKLSDFGVSFMMENGTDNIETSAGSYYYYSPEACMGATYKGKKSDIWACGITLYYMIYKQHPFEASLIPELFKKIQTDEPTYRPKNSSMLSFPVPPLLRELLKGILTKNPEDRYSLTEIKAHPWITSNGADPMPTLERNQLAISDTEKKEAFSKVNLFGQVILKKLSNMQREMNQQQITQNQKQPGQLSQLKFNSPAFRSEASINQTNGNTEESNK